MQGSYVLPVEGQAVRVLSYTPDNDTFLNTPHGLKNISRLHYVYVCVNIN